MLISFNFEMLLSDMVHLLGGDVYLNCMNVKLLIDCEWVREGLLCEVRW